MLYIVHSCSYTILHGVCLWESDDNTSLTDYDIITSICDCAAVCNSAVSLFLGSYPPSFLLLAILQGDIDRSLTAGQEVSSDVLAK